MCQIKESYQKMISSYFMKMGFGILALTILISVGLTEDFDDMSIYHLPSKWENQDGKEVVLSELKGNVLVVVMIYTSCQAACPILIGEMKSLEAQIREKSSGDVKYILVSIDPEQDTPERLKKLSQENKMSGDRWLFLRGTIESTRDFANLLAVKYTKISPVDFSHSNIISVFDKKGVLIHQQEGLRVDNKATIDKILELVE